MSGRAELVRLNLQVAVDAALGLPAAAEFAVWANAAAAAMQPGWSKSRWLAVRLIDAAESTQYNQQYRGKTGPTNVLAFPVADHLTAQQPDEPELGDLLICWPVVQAEAAAQGKPVVAHLAHLTVHGVLHLLGHDHQELAAAATMEALETRIMRDLDFADPYSDAEATRVRPHMPAARDYDRRPNGEPAAGRIRSHE